MKHRLIVLLLFIALAAGACQTTTTGGAPEPAQAEASATSTAATIQDVPQDPLVPLPEPTPSSATGPIDMDPADLPSLYGTIRPLPSHPDALVPIAFDGQAGLAASASGQTVRLQIVQTRSDQPDSPFVITGEANTATGYQRLWTWIEPYMRFERPTAVSSVQFDVGPGMMEQLRLDDDVTLSRGVHPRQSPVFADTQPDRWYETRSIGEFVVGPTAAVHVDEFWQGVDNAEILSRSAREQGGWSATADVRTAVFDRYRGPLPLLGPHLALFANETRVTVEADADGQIARYHLVLVDDEITKTFDVRFFDRAANLDVPAIAEVFALPPFYSPRVANDDHGWQATGQYRSSSDDPLAGPFSFSGSYSYNLNIELLSMPAADYAEMLGLDPIDSDVPIERQGTDLRFVQSRGLVPEMMAWWTFPDVSPETQYGYNPFGDRMPSILRLAEDDMGLWRSLAVEPAGQPNPDGWDVYRTTTGALDPATIRFLAGLNKDSFLVWVEVADDATGATLTVGADDNGVIERLRVEVEEADGGGGIWEFEIVDVFEPTWSKVRITDQARIEIRPQWQEYLDAAADANAMGEFDSFYAFALEQRSVVETDDTPEHLTIVATSVRGGDPEHAEWFQWPGTVGLRTHQLGYGFGSNRNDIICLDLGPEAYRSRSHLQRLWNELPPGQALTSFEVYAVNPYVMDFYAFDGERPANDPCVWFREEKLPGFG